MPKKSLIEDLAGRDYFAYFAIMFQLGMLDGKEIMKLPRLNKNLWAYVRKGGKGEVHFEQMCLDLVRREFPFALQNENPLPGISYYDYYKLLYKKYYQSNFFRGWNDSEKNVDFIRACKLGKVDYVDKYLSEVSRRRNKEVKSYEYAYVDGGGITLMAWLNQQKKQYQPILDIIFKYYGNDETLYRGRGPVYWAVLCGRELKEIKQLIDQGKHLPAGQNNPNPPNVFDQLLMAACIAGNLDAVKFFLEEKNANLHAAINEGPLVAAIRNEQLNVVRYLAKHKDIDLNHPVEDSEVSPLTAALEEGNVDIVEALLDADIDRNSAAGSSLYRHPNLVIYFLYMADLTKVKVRLYDKKHNEHIQIQDPETRKNIASGERNMSFTTLQNDLKQALATFANKDNPYFSSNHLMHLIKEKYFDILKAHLQTEGVKLFHLFDWQYRSREAFEILKKAGRQDILNVFYTLAEKAATDSVNPSEWKDVFNHGLMDWAIETNQSADCFKELEQNGHHCNYTLKHLCELNAPHILKELLNRDPSPHLDQLNDNYDNKNSDPALVTAMKNGHVEVVKVLLDTKGIEFNKQLGHKPRFSHGDNRAKEKLMTPFRLAIQLGNAAIVEALLEKGVNLELEKKPNPLNVAIMTQKTECAKALIEEINKDPNNRKYLDSALSVAIEKENAEIIQSLLDAGVDVNQKLEGGLTPLKKILNSYSYESDKQFACVRTLLEYGADPNGDYPLGLAAKRGKFRSIQALIDKGVNVNGPNSDPPKKTPLVMACEVGNIENLKAVETLLQNYADVNRGFPLIVALNTGIKQKGLNFAIGCALSILSSPKIRITEENHQTILDKIAKFKVILEKNDRDYDINQLGTLRTLVNNRFEEHTRQQAEQTRHRASSTQAASRRRAPGLLTRMGFLEAKSETGATGTLKNDDEDIELKRTHNKTHAADPGKGLDQPRILPGQKVKDTRQHKKPKPLLESSSHMTSQRMQSPSSKRNPSSDANQSKPDDTAISHDTTTSHRANAGAHRRRRG